MFRRLISQSIGGPAAIRQTLAEDQATGEFLAAQLGLDSEVSADRLRQIPAEKILEAVAALPADHYFSAVIDGKTVSRHPLEILRLARTAGVDLIAGTNADEWYMYVEENTTQNDLNDWVAENAPGQQAALLAMVADEADARSAMDRLRTAQEMLCPSRYLATRINESGGRAWVYYFSRQRVGSGGKNLRVYHWAELPYVFDRHDNWLPTQEADHALTGAILDYWV